MYGEVNPFDEMKIRPTVQSRVTAKPHRVRRIFKLKSRDEKKGNFGKIKLIIGFSTFSPFKKYNFLLKGLFVSP